MSSRNLDNLVAIRKLKKEAAAQKEFDGLLKSARVRLADAQREGLSSESQFDLRYNAAHALALAALRWHGYRSDNRYLVFQCLADTVGMPAAEWRVLARAHELRNIAEYEGDFGVGEQLMADLVKVTGSLLKRVEGLGPIA